MAEPLPSDPSPAKIRFTRYLYISSEYPVYHSNPPPTSLTLEKLPSLEELASDPSTELFPLQKIASIFPSAPSLHPPQALLFALAASARQQKSEKLRHAAYDFAKTLKDPNHFFLFISFASRLSRTQSVPKHGYGHGWRTAVNHWYLSKTPQDLSQIVSKHKSLHGWTHKDLLKLSHPLTSPLPSDLKAVLKYATSGLQTTKTEFSNDSKAREIIETFEKVENFRKCEDPISAAAMIRAHGYDLQQVHAGLMRSEEVWEALIEGMDLPSLIKNLKRINENGFIKVGSQISEKVVSAFLDKEEVLRSKIGPAEVFLEVKRYENPEGVPMPVKRRLGRKNKLKNRGIPRADKKVVEAIYKALDTSFSNVGETGLKYLITVSSGGRKGENLEGSLPWVVEAACLVALGLLRAEEKVTVSTFTGVEGLNARPVTIEKNAGFEETVERVKGRSTGPSNLGKPMLWAAHHRRKFDVFINVVDKMREKYDFTGRAMDLYKKKMNLPNTRLINWVVGSTSTYMEGRDVQDVLTVCGFDAQVPRIIEAFAKHEF